MRGSDGRRRCGWGLSAPDYQTYHDEEWGRPVTDDRGLYERLTLEAFQSGLSWLTILRKREASGRPSRASTSRRSPPSAPATSAGCWPTRASCATGPRSRRRSRNARATTELDRPLGELLWSFAPAGRRRAPRAFEDVPAITPESTAMAKELKRRGFRFVGPTTAYATMQACGMVNDHLAGCFVRSEVEGDRKSSRGS